MLTIWVGEESYLINDEMEKVKSALVCPEMDFIKGELDENNYYACDMASLFSDKKALFLYSSLKNPYLEMLVEREPYNDVAVILTGEITKTSALYKKLDKKKLIRNFGRLSAKDFDVFCRKQLEGAEIGKEDYGYLIRRIMYGKRENCDLYTVKNFIGQLVSAPQINKETIDYLIPEYQEDNVFRLFSFLTAKNGKAYFGLLDRLLDSDPKGAIGILSVLLRNFRIAYKASVAGDEAAELIGISGYALECARNISQESAKECMNILQEAVNRIKTGFPQRIAVMEASSRLLQIMRG